MAQQPTVYYAVFEEHAENWDKKLSLRQQKQWGEHAAFMDAMTDERFVVLGGPFDDGDNVLLIFAAESEQTVRTRLANDPWIRSGLLRITSIKRWQILLDSKK
ncbi:MAG TPA: YciI family protein [Ktedonobacteraceae bacterium]|nr:YciI family protein [Ktedonobacteraceae bacterium]